MVKRILVVDDEYDDLKTVKEILEKEGYEILVATNGEKAVEILKANNLDMMLTNIKMPIMSGYDLIKQCVTLPNNVEMKKLFISIVPENEVDMGGVDGFVQKPFTPESLIGKVKKLLI